MPEEKITTGTVRIEGCLNCARLEADRRKVYEDLLELRVIAARLLDAEDRRVLNDG